MYKVGELSKVTGVKEGTIRFYEKCGFLEKIERLPNGYRIYTERHLYQVKICRLVFGGFVNRRLRKASVRLIATAKEWDLNAYEIAASEYRKAIQEDIERTRKVIELAVDAASLHENSGMQEVSKIQYTKKQAAELVGTSEEAIRNWERNGLIPKAAPYQKRYYSQAIVNRMHVIQLLLDSGFGIMPIFRFLQKMDSGNYTDAKKLLINPEEGEDLQSKADYYLQALLALQQKADTLYCLLEEMKKI